MSFRALRFRHLVRRRNWKAAGSVAPFGRAFHKKMDTRELENGLPFRERVWSVCSAGHIAHAVQRVRPHGEVPRKGFGRGNAATPTSRPAVYCSDNAFFGSSAPLSRNPSALGCPTRDHRPRRGHRYSYSSEQALSKARLPKSTEINCMC